MTKIIYEEKDIFMARCLAILKPEKNEYRFVYDNTICNEFILSPGIYENGPIGFTTPSVETILLNPFYLKQLQISNQAFVFDATAYYRQIFTHQSAWNLSMFQLTNGQTYLDVTSRMGHINSSISAQRVSDLKDWIFNNSEPFAGVSLTNQDDSIILNANEKTGQKFRALAEKMGILINQSKNQCGSNITWCGYDFNLREKRIQIRKKRIDKLKKVCHEILSSKTVTRRKIAVFLGSVHSCRPIILGQWKFTSPLLYFTRKSTFLFSNVYDEKILDSEWYEEKIVVNELMKVEIKEAMELVVKSVKISHAANGLSNYLSMGSNYLSMGSNYLSMGSICSATDHNLIFSDASDTFWSVTLKLGQSHFSFSGEFDNSMKSKWTIYVKEYYACVWAKLLFWFISKSLGNKITRTFHFIDNTGARAVLQSRKVSLKSIEIGILSKFNQMISDRLTENEWSYHFIDSESNKWSDYCTRDGAHKACNMTHISKKFCPFVCLLSGVYGSDPLVTVDKLVFEIIKCLNL